MRVLHVVPTYLPAVRYGGPIHSVHGLCAALAARGHDVQVFTTNVDGTLDSDVPLEVPVDLDGVKVWYFPSRRLRRLYWSPRMAHMLGKRIDDFDLVHLHSVFLWPTWAAARTARRAKIPYVISPRGMLVKSLIRQRNAVIKSLWIALIERHNIESASGVHLTAALELKELRAFGFDLPATRVIANGVSTTPDMIPNEGVSEDVACALQNAPFVLNIGRLSWKKNLGSLIRAVATEPRLRLVIAGNDDEGYAKQIHRIVAECGIESRTTVLPRFVSGADKDALLAGATAFALPSLSENFANAVVEAMAAGCPVVVSEGVGLADTVADGEAGIVAQPDQFGRALTRLVDEPALRESMAINARRIAAERFGWPFIAAEMEALYEATRQDVARSSQRFGS